MDRAAIVNNIATELYATEKAVDEAIAHATALVQSMISGRAALGVSPVAGTASQSKAMETIAALGAARELIVAAHAEMQKDHRRMGWGVYAAGPIGKPDEWDDRPMIRKGEHLRVA